MLEIQPSSMHASPVGLALKLRSAVAGLLITAAAVSVTAQTPEPVYVFSALAGSPAGGAGITDGTGALARFNGPNGVATDTAGNIYIADQGSHTIRKVTPAGVVTTYAGSPGQSGTIDGPGVSARFKDPSAIAVDDAGNVYVADMGNSTIRKITPDGVASTLAGTAGQPGNADGTGASARFGDTTRGVAVDGGGNVYVADTFNSTIRKISPAGVVTTLAGSAGRIGWADGAGANASFSSPAGIAVEGAGIVYVADSGNRIVRKITPDGWVSTLAGFAGGEIDDVDATGAAARFTSVAGIAIDPMGNTLYVTQTPVGRIRKISSAGVVTALAGGAPGVIDRPVGVAVNSEGIVYVADQGGHTLQKITPTGIVTTLAGAAYRVVSGSADGTGSQARFASPTDVAVDEAGNAYVTDTSNSTIRKITAAGIVTTLAGVPGQTGSVDGPGTSARFVAPQGVAVDSAGNIYVGDNSTVRKITPHGVVSTVAGTAGMYGYPEDGTGPAARFGHIADVAVDRAGNVYVTEFGDTLLSRYAALRKVTPAGVVTTLAWIPGTSYPRVGSVAVDGDGNAYVGLNGEFVIYKVTPDGTLSAYASAGPAPDLAVDGAGVVYIADAGDHTIRRLTPDGVVSTIAGVEGATGNADGPGAVARFTGPQGIAVDADGNLYVADTLNTAIRKGVRIVPAEPIAPAIAAQPRKLGVSTVPTGMNASFVVSITGSPLSYQWQRRLTGTAEWTSLADSGVYSGTSTSTLTVTGASGTMNGDQFRCIVTNSAGSVTTEAAVLNVTVVRLVNLSARTHVADGDDIQVAGFVIAGTESKQVLVRASGPALVSQNVPGVLERPRLRLFHGQTVVAANTIWGTAANAADIKTVAARVGAFAWPDNSNDSALLVTLPPGIYTAQVSGESGGSGIALIEVYDAGIDPGAPCRLMNISSRARVGTDERIQIAGFVITGDRQKQVLIRAGGPALATQIGLTGALDDPLLELFQRGQRIAQNSGWSGDGGDAVRITAARVGAYPWLDDTNDAALLVTLDPGLYTAHVSSRSGGNGLVLLEVYDADPE